MKGPKTAKMVVRKLNIFITFYINRRVMYSRWSIFNYLQALCRTLVQNRVISFRICFYKILVQYFTFYFYVYIPGDKMQ